MSMSKSLALVLVFVFLMASGVIGVKPVLGTTMAENSWVSKAPMQVARSDLGVAVVNGKIYAIGGTNLQGIGPTQSGGIVGINEEYEPASDTWTFKAPMPTPRMDFAIAVYQNKIYCIGGSVGVSTNPDEVLTRVNEVYDPAKDVWETKAAMPVSSGSLQANVVSDKIYVIGELPNGTLNEVYDPASDTWTLKLPMPENAISGSSVVFNKKIYFFGGDFDVNGHAISITQTYDPEKNSWSLGTPPPTFFFEGCAGITTSVMAPKRIYVFATPYVDTSISNYTLHTNQVYDPTTDSWTFGTDIPTYRERFGVAVVNDIIYVIGGSTLYVQSIVAGGYGYVVTKYATNEKYIPFGYGTVPPVASILSPENVTYNESSVPLTFTLDKPFSWLGYSLDGKNNVTIGGNTTLAGLSNGMHNISVYAQGNNGDIGVSETVTFNIASETFPTATVVIVLAGSAFVVIAGLLVYFARARKNKKREGCAGDAQNIANF